MNKQIWCGIEKQMNKIELLAPLVLIWKTYVGDGINCKGLFN